MISNGITKQLNVSIIFGGRIQLPGDFIVSDGKAKAHENLLNEQMRFRIYQMKGLHTLRSPYAVIKTAAGK